MFRSQSKFSTSSKANFFRAGLVIFLCFFSPGLVYSTCSLPGIITTDTTITGACTLVRDLYINPGVTLTITPPCTLYMRPLFDSINLGSDPQRIEILVAGIFRVAGNSSPTGKVVFRSNHSPSGNAGDWYGIRRAASTARIRINYAELLDGWIMFYTATWDETMPYNGLDSVLNSRFENWGSHAIANTREPFGQRPLSPDSAVVHMRDSLIIQGNVFLGGGTQSAIDFTHDFGAVIDSNKFLLNQDTVAVFLDDYGGTVTRNCFYANNGASAIRASGCPCGGDSTTIAQNTIEGFYSYAHIHIAVVIGPPPLGFRITENRFITGRGTPSSLYGLRTNFAGTAGAVNYRLLARKNIFAQFDSAAIFSSAGNPLFVGDDFGNMDSSSPGNNAFLLPCNPNAKAIKRVGGTAIKAEGNWFGTSTPDSSSLFEGQIDLRPFLTVPAIPFYGKLGRTSTWAAGNDTLIGDFTLDSCATPVTLMLNPGVRILAAANQDVMRSGRDTTKTEFIVKGTLTALGTQTDSIKFLSSSSSPTKMDWGGLFFSHPARGNFTFAQFSHADTAISVRDTATVKVRNSTFSHFKTLAVYSKSSKVNLGYAPASDCGKNNVFMKTADLNAKAVTLDAALTIWAQGNWWDSVPPPAGWFAGAGEVIYDHYLTQQANPSSTCAGDGGGGCGGPGNGPCGAKITVVDDSRPTKFELAQNYPNPFNAATVIRFALPQPSRVELRIYNILGQAVRTFIDEKPSGLYEVFWDGRDESGAAVSSGIYLYQVRAGSYVETKKMQLVK